LLLLVAERADQFSRWSHLQSSGGGFAKVVWGGQGTLITLEEKIALNTLASLLRKPRRELYRGRSHCALCVLRQKGFRATFETIRFRAAKAVK
jgi:hypothetical protein